MGQASGKLVSDAFSISIRPEYLRLSPATDTSTGLVGTVDFVRLLGPSVETELTIGDRMFIHTMISDRPPTFAVGERAEISFDLDHAWVIPS